MPRRFDRSVDLLLMNPCRVPRRLVPIVFLASGPGVIDVVGNVTTCAEADQMRVISRRTNRNGFGCPSVDVAEMMGDFLELVPVELLALLDLV